MIEVKPASAVDSGLAEREAIESAPTYSYRVPIQPGAYAEDLETHFAEALDLGKMGFDRKVSVFEGQLPAYSGGRHHLAIVCTFKKGGQWWRQGEMSKFTQATAVIDGSYFEFTCTPDFRQTGSYQWNPWLVFSAPLPIAFKDRPMRIGITSYLPNEVELVTNIWVLREWWRPQTRPLPNHWT